MFPNRRNETMKPIMKPKRTTEQRAEEEAVRRQHAANPVRQRPAGALNRQSFAAILSLAARFKAVRESQGLTLAEVAGRMGIDAPALSRLETGKMLNPTLATLHKWAEALGQKLDFDPQRLGDSMQAAAWPYRALTSYLRLRLDRLQSCHVLIEDKLYNDKMALFEHQ